MIFSINRTTIAIWLALTLWSAPSTQADEITYQANYVDKLFYSIEDFPKALIFRDKARDWFPWTTALSDPDWVDGNSAEFMRDEDFVVGIVFNDRAYAIPWWKMKNHHVANLVFDENPVLITFCEVCSSASAFSPVIDRNRHTFRIKGVYNGTIFVEDLESGTYWAPFSGKGLYGKHKDFTLNELPLYQGTWRNWFELFPHTLVSHGVDKERHGHAHENKPGSPKLNKLFKSTMVQEIDERLKSNMLVFGVTQNSESVAFAYDRYQSNGGLINTEVGGSPVLIIKLPGSLISAAYSRMVESNELEFENLEDGLFQDKKTASSWDITGLAVDGPMKGTKLQYISSGVEEWYVWAAYHPNTEIRFFDP